jgi:GntR family transcriptional regulator/MocR family aminotransferase
VIITSGTQQALDLVGRLLIDEGDEVWMEDPGYTGALQSLRAAGAKIAFIPVNREGLDVKLGILSAPRAKLIYTTPTNQFPLGVCMSLARRKELLAWSGASGTWIVEDEYDAEYCYGERPEASLLSMEGAQNVIYMGTFTKLLFNAIRLGFIIVPLRLAETFGQARSFIDKHPATLDQAVLADFMQNGHFGHHVQRMRAVYKERHTCLASLVEEYVPEVLQLETRATGMSTIGWLPSSLCDAAVSSQLLREGVEALPLSLFCSRNTAEPGLILGFAGCGPEELKRGVQIVARISERWEAQTKSAQAHTNRSYCVEAVT